MHMMVQTPCIATRYRLFVCRPFRAFFPLLLSGLHQEKAVFIGKYLGTYLLFADYNSQETQTKITTILLACGSMIQVR